MYCRDREVPETADEDRSDRDHIEAEFLELPLHLHIKVLPSCPTVPEVDIAQLLSTTSTYCTYYRDHAVLEAA